MPPKAKFTKEQIIAAGLDIIRVEGLENLSARAIGKKLGSSACPIFTVFENMDEVQAEVKKAAAALYGEYIKYPLCYTGAQIVSTTFYDRTTEQADDFICTACYR